MHKLIFQRNKIIKIYRQGLICIYRDLKRNQTHDILNNLSNAPYNFFIWNFLSMSWVSLFSQNYRYCVLWTIKI